MSSDDLDKIFAKAAKLKKADRLREEKNRPKPAPVKPLPVTPTDDERWPVFRKFAMSNISFFWWLPLTLITLPIIFGSGGKISQTQIIISILLLIAVPAGRYLFGWVYALATFHRFRTWRQRLPFSLIGWEKLVDSPKFQNNTFWRLKGALILELTPDPKFDTKALQALLYLFCRKANSEFYVPEVCIGGFSGDPRKEWSTGGTSAHGSVNNGVANQIYCFLDQQLGPLAKKHGVSGQVTIEVSNEEYEIEPYPTSSEGTAS